MTARRCTSLDGVWEFRLDPSDRGRAEQWWQPGIRFGRTIPVPLPWQTASPDYARYAGVAWYRRRVALPAPAPGRTVAIRFGAVDYAAEVWIEGRPAGRHEGGFDPFVVDVPHGLTGDAALVVRVADPLGNQAEIPHGKQGASWYTPVSGIWQSVTLLERPLQRIDRLLCRPDASRGTVHIQPHLTVDAPARLELSVYEAGRIDPVARADTAEGAALALPNPQPWHPDTPHLYRVVGVLRDPNGAELDRQEERFGLRDVAVRNGRILLNGRPLYMRGVLDQGFWPGTLYTPPCATAFERDLVAARNLGFNLVRKHMKPEDPRFLAAADRLGMLVWAEPANPVVDTPRARACIRRDLLAMVRRDFNHPSIIAWNLYNEDWGLPALWSEPDRQSWLETLVADLRSADPTRLICDNSGWSHVTTDINDYHEYGSAPEGIGAFARRLDFIIRHPDENYARGRSAGGQPVIISEVGNWAITDPAAMRARNGGRDPPWFGYGGGYAQAEGLPALLPEHPLTERIKTIEGLEDRFQEAGLARVFGSVGALVNHAQQRTGEALKAQLEEIRRRPALSGYVVTQLYDVEWEANGWLDDGRRAKAFAPVAAAANAPLAILAAPDRHSAWAGEDVGIAVQFANDTGQAIEADLAWRIMGTSVAGESRCVADAGQLQQIRFTAPKATGPALLRVDYELRRGATVLARSHSSLAVAPRLSDARRGELNGHTLERVFRQRLERAGYAIPRDFRSRIPLAVCTYLDEDLLRYVEGGGKLLFLAGLSTDGAELAGLRFNTLCPSVVTGWRLAAGIAWADIDRLQAGLLSAGLGWEAASIFPRHGIRTDSLRPEDTQYAGWFEGWIANPCAFAVLQRMGSGRLLTTTFRLEDSYGMDPVATLVLNRLLAIAAANDGP